MRSLAATCLRGLTPLAVGLALIAAGCGAERSASGQLGPRYGVSASLPEGWYGRLSRGALVAATFPLPREGSVSLREMAFLQLEEDDVRVLLFENAPENRSPPTDLGEYPTLVGELQFEASDFSSTDGNSDDSALTGHGFARRTVRTLNRLFVVFVETGVRPPRPRALAELNELLGSLEVQAGDFYPGAVAPPRFTARPGWHLGTSGPDEVDADGEFTTSWAATIPYADEWNALPPVQTLERLPRDGIVLWLGLSRTNRFPPPKEIRRPPFRLSEFERVDFWEGQVHDVPEYRLWGTVGEDIHLDLRVYFGRPDPTAAVRDEAQAMLEGLELPEWGPWELEP